MSAGKIDRVVNKETVSPPQFMTLRDVGCGDLRDHKWKLEQFLNFRDVISQGADDRRICFQFVQRLAGCDQALDRRLNQHLAMQNLGDDDRCQVRLNFFAGYALEEAFGISGCSRDVIEEDVGVN